MRAVLLDTALLAIPSYSIDAEGTIALVERVALWARTVLADVPVAIILSVKASEIIWEANCGPTVGSLEDLFAMVGVGEAFSANDFISAYYALLDRAVSCVSYLGYEVETMEEFRLEPDPLMNLNPEALVRETERLQATVGLSFVSGYPILFGSAFSEDHPQKIEVTATVKSLLGESLTAGALINTKFRGEVSLISTLEDLLDALGSVAIWNSATNAREGHFAIALRAVEMLRHSGNAEFRLSDVENFWLGTKFWESLVQTQCQPMGRFGGSTLELCAQLVAGKCRRHVGVFGRPKQIKRKSDAAEGFRVHLTEGSEGLRLMYWKKEGGIEFSNVGVKKELMIEEGVCENACIISY